MHPVRYRIRGIFRRLEERLLSPSTRASADELDLLLSDDFVEFGSSGRVYGKVDTIAALVATPSVVVKISDFRLCVSAPGVALLLDALLRRRARSR